MGGKNEEEKKLTLSSTSLNEFSWGTFYFVWSSVGNGKED